MRIGEHAWETVQTRTRLQVEGNTSLDGKSVLHATYESSSSLRGALFDKAQCPVSYGLSGRLQMVQVDVDLRSSSRNRFLGRSDVQDDEVDGSAADGAVKGRKQALTFVSSCAQGK
jgi:hypothetical protein